MISEVMQSDLKLADKENNGKNLILPLLPIRDITIFPHAISPLFVGRIKSVAAVDRACFGNKMIFMATQKNPDVEHITAEDMAQIGTVGTIIQSVRLPDDTLKILIDANYRARIVNFRDNGNFFEVELEVCNVEAVNNPETQALVRHAVEKIKEYLGLTKKMSAESMGNIEEITDAGTFADMVMSHLPLNHKIKQSVLEAIDVIPRLEKICAILSSEIEILQAEKNIQDRIKAQIDKNHKEYYLNEQIKAIKKELGDGDGVFDTIEKYEQLLKTKKLSEEAAKKAKEEIRKLNGISPTSAESIKSYLDWIFSLPWNEQSETTTSLNYAQDVLSNSHYGLEKVKEIIIEYIAVQLQKKDTKSAILCLYGPPGVGKTTLVRAIAKAMGRKYAKIALGGVHDESEIRGHRRTYVASMPGRLIQTMKKVGTNNPVILLDEIDKMSRDYRGDPESALLEALDPEQNKSFQDHYLEVEYDLSNVMFIATANSLTMQRPLLDRLEIVHVPSYLEMEKLAICKQHIIPKQLESVGLLAKQFAISDNAILDLINFYTRESGVREVERLIGKLARKSLVKIMSAQKEDDAKNAKPEELGESSNIVEVESAELTEASKDFKKTKNNVKISVTQKNLSEFLGIKKYVRGHSEVKNLVGVTNGLAYTEVGGDVLLIEAVKIPSGKGEVKITGKLGEVMKESAQAALSYVRSKCEEFGINPIEIKDNDLHIHVPEGATPKDGPSAGVTMCTTLVSLLTGIPVRFDVAMTGEITLRGRVLPIGGLREKMVAAIKNHIKIILIPKENVKDLEDIPSHIKDQIEIIPCETITDVLKIALVTMPSSKKELHKQLDAKKRAAEMSVSMQ